MRLLAKLVVLSLLLAGGYKAYQHPKVKQLFNSPEKKENPLAFLEDLPELTPKPLPPKRTPRSPRPVPQVPREQETVEVRDGAVEDTEVIEYQNQVPNEELRRVLMQILAARKLASGISLIVTDRRVEVVGEVQDAESRRKILETVDKGREARRLDGTKLVVAK
jgi:hypothetical protein